MLGTVIGIIGIIVGLASVVLAAVFEWRRKKYPKRMRFYILDAVRLTSPIVDELKNVTLVYDDKPITKTVSYLKTLFANSGTKDVDLQLIQKEDALSIKLPNECRWLTVELKDKSKGLKVSLEIDETDPSILYVTGGVFKKDELFSFDAFIEGEFTKEDVEEKRINVNHRFYDTENIKVEKMYDLEQKGRKKLIFPLIYSIVISIGSLFSLYMINNNVPAKFVEKELALDSVTLYSAYVGNMDSLIVVEDNKITFPWNITQFSLKDFNDKYELSTLVSKERKIMQMVCGILFILVVVMVIFFFVFFVMLDNPSQRKVIKRYSNLINTLNK